MLIWAARIFYVFLDSVLAFLFLGIFVIAVAPSIGLDFIPESAHTFIKKSITEITVGGIGYIICSLLIERLISLRPIKHNLYQLTESVQINNQNIKAIETRLDTQISSSLIFTNREASYLHLYSKILTLPSYCHVYVTHFEKNRTAPYDKGERDAEKNFMEAWSKAIIQDKLTVHQIVHMTSQFDFQELTSRLTSYKECRNYNLYGMVGPYILPYQDIIVAKGHWLYIALPMDSENPCIERTNIFLESKSLSEAYANAIQACISSEFCINIFTNKYLDKINLERISKILPKVENEHYANKFSFLPCPIAILQDSSENLINSLMQLSSLAYRHGTSSYISSLKNIISSFQDNIAEEEKRKISYSGINAAQALIELVANAKKCIKAVSVDLTESNFWQTEIGKELLSVNKKISQNGVIIQRIFIVESRKKAIKEAINIHGEIADCKIVDKKQYTDLKDYLIIDDSVIYEIIEEDNAEIKSSVVCTDSEYIAEKGLNFMQLWNKANSLDTFFNKRLN